MPRKLKLKEENTLILSLGLFNMTLLFQLNMNRFSFRGRLVNRRNHSEVELEPALGQSHILSALNQVNKRGQGPVICIFPPKSGKLPLPGIDLAINIHIVYRAESFLRLASLGLAVKGRDPLPRQTSSLVVNVYSGLWVTVENAGSL